MVYPRLINGYNGLLPTPNSSAISSKDPAAFVGQSYYPIPHQAIIAIENANIHEITSWDIQVTTQSVKIKIEWSTTMVSSATANAENIPKAVINSISTYNLIQPVWSISFSKNLSLKCEWKLLNVNSKGTHPYNPVYKPVVNQYVSPPAINVQTGINDSGYSSFHQSPALNYSTPFTQSRYPNRRRFEVYKPKQPVFSPPRKEANVNPTIGEEPKISSVADYTTNSKGAASTSKDFGNISASVHAIPTPSPSLHNTTSCPTIQVEDPPSNEVPIPTPQQSTSQELSFSNQCHDPNPFHEQSTSLETTEITSLPSNIVPQDQSKSVSGNDTDSFKVLTIDDKFQDTAVHEKSVSVKSSESPKYSVSESKSHHIVLQRDPLIDPSSNKFVKAPKPVPKSKKGKFLNRELDAGRMAINGHCRICGLQVKSCYADYHLLTCQDVDDCELIDFYKDYEAKTRGTDCDIEAMAYDYCQYKLSDADINNVFNIDSVQSFIDDLELVLEKRSMDFFKKLGCPDQKRRFNILRY